VTRNLSGTELKRLHRRWRRRTNARVGLVLEDVQNPFNVGAILRTAAAYAVDDLWLVGSTASAGHPKVAKTALGSQRFVTTTVCHGIGDALAAAGRAGYAAVGLELAEGAVPLPLLPTEGDVCLVLGHEDRGLSKEALALCPRFAYLPMLGRIGSLNVGTAAALGVYELRRREWLDAGPDPR
jgi:tRNA (guanosine-2'-O-)-methyltransferase